MNRPALALAGALFTIGLALAGTVSPHVVLAAFRFDAAWDPRLWLMFAGAVIVALLTTRPDRSGDVVDRRLVIGSLVFGVGWAIAGLCPAMVFATAATGSAHAAIALAGLCVGIAVHDRREGV